MRGAPSLATISGVPPLIAECRNAAVGTKLDGSRRVFAGTAAALYELVAGAWSDVSRGAGYTLGADDRWDAVQFGDATLLANKSCKIQRSPGSGAFADIASAPQAMAIESAAGFVVAFNTNAGNDYWHCCALMDDTDWAISLSNQATSGRLVSTPGEITAAKVFGDQIVAYKDRSMYLGRYVGSPVVWQWDVVPGDVGCVGPDAVTDLGGLGHIIVGRSDIMLFDGTRPVSIVSNVLRQWFYSNVSQQFLYRTIVIHDKQNGVVWIFYPSVSSSVCDQALVYHLTTKRWGKATQTIEAALNYVQSGASIDGLDAYAATIDTLPPVSLDSQYWLAGGRVMSLMTSAHQLSTLSGVCGASSMTLWDVGDDQVVTQLKRLRVGYQVAPASASAVGQQKLSRGETLAAGSTGAYVAGKFDMRQSARFHRVRVDAVGDWVAAAVDFDLSPAGQR
jgi:hypothetical protein